MRLSQYGVIVLVIVFLTTCGVTDAYARSQRMGIPKGTIATLSPKSSKSVGAFCLDYHRPAPSAGTRLGHVLTASGSAMVQVAGQGAAIPLAQAISEGIVRVGGRDLDLVQKVLGEFDAIRENPLMNLMLPPELSNPNWFDQTPAERLAFLKVKLEAKVAAELESSEVAGDFSHLELANLTDKEITVSFAETTVLSEAPEPIADSRVSELRPLRPGESPEELQRELWIRDSQRHL